MALGTALEADLETAFANSTDAAASAALVATAINNYLSGAVYGDGAVLWTGTVVGATFELPTSGTAAGAATAWGNGIMGYWGASGVATGLPGVPTTLDSVIAPILVTASTVGPELTTTFTDVFSFVEKAKTQAQIDACKAPLLIQKADLEAEIAILEAIPNPTPEEEAELLAKQEELLVVEDQIAECEAQQSSQSYKATQIADAITTAVGNIVVSWSEFTAGPPPVTLPLTGGIA